MIAGILTMIWVIMGSEEEPVAGTGDQQIASIVLSAVNFPILMYLGISMYLSKYVLKFWKTIFEINRKILQKKKRAK